jgi:hypothetical protein
MIKIIINKINYFCFLILILHIIFYVNINKKLIEFYNM